MNLNMTIFFQMIVFFVLAWVTMKFIWPPLTKAIDERRQKIAEGLAAAEKGKADLAQAQARVSLIEASAKSELHARMTDAEKHAAQIIEQARAEAEVERARILAQAKQDAAQYFQKNNTLEGWKGKLPSIGDFDPAPTKGATDPQAVVDELRRRGVIK